jgi:hypothetical protein
MSAIASAIASALSASAGPDARFPITRGLDAAGRARFAAIVDALAAHPNLAVRNDPERAGAQVIAGHLTELFFHRPDILARFLLKPRHFHLYDSAAAFAADGGVGGGCYQPRSACIQLVRSRLTEGFGRDWPGVAPLLHELGHMLDHFNPRTGGVRLRCDGLLPGLHPGDGDVFTPDARAAFVVGRRLEFARYRDYRRGKPGPIPVGHPYVLRNNGEFCAGYLEMFLRNPNSFADMNPLLFDGYVLLLRWDPRTVWPEDFGFYLAQNRACYTLSHAHPTTRLNGPEGH